MNSLITKILMRDTLGITKRLNPKIPALIKFQDQHQESFKYNNSINTLSSNFTSVRFLTRHHIFKPDPNTCKKNLRFEVEYPKDGKYTIEKLKMRKLGGRDPETGRLIFGCIGGGHKRKFRWVQEHRIPLDHPSDSLVEKVVGIRYDPNRTCRIALVGQADKLRYIIATSLMKEGDLILSTRELPRMTIRPKEGNAHPVGALPTGTKVCCIETHPKAGFSLMHNAGCNATILRKIDKKVHVKLSQFREVILDQRCIVVVGQVSNVDHASKPIGSPWRLRWLGRRPRSGLFQKKTGRHGRKFKKLKVFQHTPPIVRHPIMELTIHGEGGRKKVIPATNRVS